MLYESILSKAFSAPAQRALYADNDNGRTIRINRHDVPLVFFSPTQESQLDALVIPYLRAGFFTDIVQGKGGSSGYYNVCNERRSGYKTFLCITVEEVKDGPRKYGVNADGMRDNVETINFSEVLRAVRCRLDALFTEVPTQKVSLSLV